MKIYYFALFAFVFTNIKAQFCEPRYIELNLPALKNPKILQALSNTYYIIGVKNKSTLVFTEIESEGQIIQTNEINYTDTIELKEASITKDGNILVLTNHYKNNRFHKSRVLKLNTLGNQIWESIDTNVILVNFAETNDNQFILIGDNYFRHFHFSDCSIIKFLDSSNKCNF